MGGSVPFFSYSLYTCILVSIKGSCCRFISDKYGIIKTNCQKFNQPISAEKWHALSKMLYLLRQFALHFRALIYQFVLFITRRGSCRRVAAGMSCEAGLRCRTYHILSGSVLSVWTKVESVLASTPGGIASRMQIIRLRTEDGKKIVGMCPWIDCSCNRITATFCCSSGISRN